MKRIFFYTVLAAITLGAMPAAEAKKKYHGDRHHWRDSDRTRTIYVIENRRPVQRVVYIDDSGRYYRYYGERRSYIRGRYFTSYPSRYYYSDGRPRVGVSINF
jgi:hypothetical protein